MGSLGYDYITMMPRKYIIFPAEQPSVCMQVTTLLDDVLWSGPCPVECSVRLAEGAARASIQGILRCPLLSPFKRGFRASLRSLGLIQGRFRVDVRQA